MVFGYFFTNLNAQSLLHCDFKVMAAKEKFCPFTKITTITRIKPYYMSAIADSIITINPKGTKMSVIKSSLFALAFSLKDDRFKIALQPKNLAEKHTMANISLEKLIETEQTQETYFYKLFVPIEMDDRKGRTLFVHGLEVGPCFLE